MHPRQSSKITALQEIGNGCTAYPVFVRAASFGMIRTEEFTKIKSYQRGMKWVQSLDAVGEHATKDHRFSRKKAYDNQHEIKDLLSISLVCALMKHAGKYSLGDMPKANQALWMMAVIAGHPANAEIMTAKDNSIKGAKCTQTLPELLKGIIAWELKN